MFVLPLDKTYNHCLPRIGHLLYKQYLVRDTTFGRGKFLYLTVATILSNSRIQYFCYVTKWLMKCCSYRCNLFLQCSYKRCYGACWFLAVLFYQVKKGLTNVCFDICRIRPIIPYYFALLLLIVIIIIIASFWCVTQLLKFTFN